MSKIMFTKYVSSTNCVNKSYSLINNQIKKVSDATFVNGKAITITLSKFSDFVPYLKNADKFTAFGYGVSKYPEINICTIKSNKQDHKKYITRTKPNFPYCSGPGIIMFDYDPSPYYNNGVTLRFEEWLDILIKVFPEFDGAAYIVKHSMSASVVKIGQKNREKGFHVYFKVPNASLIPSFGKLLHEHLKAAGYGFIALSAPGHRLSKSIIDHCVFDGSRLDFVGAPTIGKGLEYKEPKVEFIPGNWLDLSKLKALTPKQLDKRDHYYSRQCEAIKPQQKKKATEYDNRKTLEYMQQGMSKEDAQAKVLKNRKRGWGVIDIDTPIHLCDNRIILLKDVVKQRLTLRFADPIKGNLHELTKAELRFDKNRKPFIWSYSYGGVRYQIAGYESAKKNNNASDSDKKKREHEFDFLYSSLLPGSGKSHYIIEQIKAPDNKNKKYLICLPSTLLMDEYETKLLSQHPRVIKSSKRSKFRTNRRSLINDRICNAVADRVRVILITHNALVQCIDHNLFKQLNDYNLVIDETFFSIIYKFSQFRLNDAISEHGLINRICEAKHYKYHDVLTIKDWSQYESFCKSNDGLDSFDKSTERKILDSIADKTKEVWMLNMKRSKKNVLFASMFNFKMLRYFKSRTLLSACCEETALYQELSRVFNMKALPMKDYCPRVLDYGKINLWPLAEVNYSMNRRDRYRYVSLDGSKRYDAQQYTNRVMKLLEFNNSVRIQNNDDYEPVDYEVDGKVKIRNQLSLSKEWVRGHVITSNCAGLNKWSHKHYLAYVAAFNFQPHITAFFNYRLPDYDIWKEHNAFKAMQCIMRTSARDINSKEPVNVIVSDYRTAAEVAKSLNGEPTLCYHPLYHEFKSEPLTTESQSNLIEFSKKSALKRGPKVKLTDAQRKENRRLYDAKRRIKRKLL